MSVLSPYGVTSERLSSAPHVSVPGMADLKVSVRLAFGTELGRNGSISELAKLN
jgi:hypothetical protein